MKNIGQISKKYGISTRTLRYYEEENLIKSVKKQQRFYCESEVERIERIIYLRKHKFTIKEIKDILLHPLFIDDLLKYIYIRRLKTKIATLEMELEKLTEEISKENICGIDTSQMSSNILEDLNSDENAIALNKRFFELYDRKENVTEEEKIAFVESFIQLNLKHKIIFEKVYFRSRIDRVKYVKFDRQKDFFFQMIKIYVAHTNRS